MLAVSGTTSLTAAKPIKRSSNPSLLFLVFIESFMAKRAMRVQMTIASSIQETMFIMVPRSAIGAVCRLRRAFSIVPRSMSAKTSGEVSTARRVNWRTSGYHVISHPTLRAAASRVLDQTTLGDCILRYQRVISENRCRMSLDQNDGVRVPGDSQRVS
jgi:hypothetical protein